MNQQVLVLNRLWQAVNICSARRALTLLFEGHAQVVLNAPDTLVQNAQRVYQQVVVTRMMPLGNITQMTDYERAVIATWIAAGAKPN